MNGVKKRCAVRSFQVVRVEGRQVSDGKAEDSEWLSNRIQEHSGRTLVMIAENNINSLLVHKINSRQIGPYIHTHTHMIYSKRERVNIVWR